MGNLLFSYTRFLMILAKTDDENAKMMSKCLTTFHLSYHQKLIRLVGS